MPRTRVSTRVRHRLIFSSATRDLLLVMVPPANSAQKLNSGLGGKRRVTRTEEVIRACHLDLDPR
jgi:hypothetical protein